MRKRILLGLLTAALAVALNAIAADTHNAVLKNLIIFSVF